MTLKLSSYPLPKFSTVSFTIVLLRESVAKVALRFGCAKQSKNLERYLIFTYQKYVILGIFFSTHIGSENKTDKVFKSYRLRNERQS